MNQGTGDIIGILLASAAAWLMLGLLIYSIVKGPRRRSR